MKLINSGGLSVLILLTVLFSCNSNNTSKDSDANETTIRPVNELASSTLGKDSLIVGEYIVTVNEQVSAAVKSALKSFKDKGADSSLMQLRIDHYQKEFSSFVAKSLEIIEATDYTFTIKAESAQVESLKADPKVIGVQQNFISYFLFPETREVECATQQLPWGVKRVSNSSKTDVYNNKVVWIIDTGIDTRHTDLNCDVKKCKSFVDGETVEDVLSHGTHVAGIIGAKSGNNSGVIGVAPNVSLRALKIFGKDKSLKASRFILALQHVLDLGKQGEVVNLSLAAYGEIPGTSKLILDIAANGLKVAIAAGNCDRNLDRKPADVDTYIEPGNTLVGIYPAKVNGTNIYTVSSFDSQGNYGACSNYGASVDYSAPGVDILSTMPAGKCGIKTGTSMAAPHVAGLLVLGTLKTDGTVKKDPDGKPDPIAHE